jgi:hypothetical protein
MRLSILNVFSLASLAISAPTAENSNLVASTTIEKRIDPHSNCGLDMYPGIGQRATRAGIRIWKGDQVYYDDPKPASVIGKQGWCTLSWVGGKGDKSVGFYFCLNADAQTSVYDSKYLGTQIEDTYKDCYGGGPPDDKKGVTRAFQYWGDWSKGDKYNLLIVGNATKSDQGLPMFPS